MPIYPYLCLCCKNEFEVEQSIKAEVGTECPKCKIWTRQRQIPAQTTFALIGAGWAADNYSSSATKKTSG